MIPSPLSAAPMPPVQLSSEWRYEMRREAQLIIPHLWLGPFQSSLKKDWLKEQGITHILCIRDQREAMLIKPRFPGEFQYMTLDISDNTDQNLITIFPQCRAFIDEAINSGGTVLAHCNGGISLSPAIVIGYIMWKNNWTYDNTLAFVQSRRYCVSPISFQIQLKEYEPIYLAQKMIGQHGAANGTRSKRGMTDDDEDDEERGPRKMTFSPNDEDEDEDESMD
ncbi:hypothetical protein JCM24511_01755 [Saitozyma sp. JCM 24511]|nr:hypothetical protein JCM24511_01755 [Saitozyma sp. JCM 24511]